MPTQERRRMREPLYAAAGVGDLAYEKMRTLPETVAKLGCRVGELRPVVQEKVKKADVKKLGGVARRNAATIATNVKAMGRKTVVAYSDMVSRGERVINDRRSAKADSTSSTTTLSSPPVESVESQIIEPTVEMPTTSTTKTTPRRTRSS